MLLRLLEWENDTGRDLQRVVADAAEDGFNFVEAYPNKVYVNTEEDFMGPVGLYLKSGFTAHCGAGQRLVMRRSLR